ncbi:MAG: hypothetical protein KDA57_20835 [Planctomycetales bacterium]|nr:hypothetical protein [Planctomycetales bacterium]
MRMLWPLALVLLNLAAPALAQGVQPYPSVPRVTPNPSLPGQSLSLVLTSSSCGVFEPDVVPSITVSGSEITAELVVIEPCAPGPTSFELEFALGQFPAGDYTLTYRPVSFSSGLPLPVEFATFSVAPARPVPAISHVGLIAALSLVLLTLGWARLTTH